MKSIFSLLIFTAFGNCFAADSAVSCDTLFRQEATGLKTITLEQFDRTPDKGWRILSDAKCFSQAEELITQYLENHEPQSSLYLHIGQLQLRQEKQAAAAANFRKALRANTTGQFKFNDFALALAAYAEQDRATFDKHMAIVAANIENFGNRQNMKLLNALSNNFSEKYIAILATLENKSSAK